MNTVIYYFTGTGNSLVVAKDIAASLEGTELTQICQDTLAQDLKTNSQSVGIITPVYFSGLPSLVKEFIEKLQINQEAYIFIIATYGDSEGIIFNQTKKLIEKKRLKLSGTFGVKMPHNIHAPSSLEKQEKYLKEEKETVILIADSIRNKEVTLKKANAAVNIFMGATYNFIQKAGNFDKKFSVDNECIGCAVCEKVCPVNNIVMEEGKPHWKCNNRCQFCAACMQWCPKQSILYGKVKMYSYHHPDIKVNDLSNQK